MTRFRWLRSLLLLAVFLLAALGVARATGLEGRQLAPLQSVLREALTPLLTAADWVGGRVGALTQLAGRTGELEQENDALRRQVGQLEADLTVQEELRQENLRLKRLLGLQETGAGGATVAARVIGRDPANWTQAVIINRGSSDGLAVGQVVISYQGLVGRLIAVSPHSSEVLLITDRQGAVAGLVQETRAPGLLQGVGDGSGLLEMLYLPRELEARPNQVIITSGLGGVFPKGLRVGYVESVVPEANGLAQKAVVRPFVDFARLEEVLVLAGG